MAIIKGWEGRYFEDFGIGDVYQHPLGRTITEADEVWCTNLVMSTNQLHFNYDYAAKTQFGRSAVNAPYTVALVTGMSVSDISQNGINLEWKEIKMPQPLFVGETLYADSVVLDKRESKSRPTQGIVTVKTRGITEKGKVVLELTRSILIYKRAHAPQTNLFPACAQ